MIRLIIHLSIAIPSGAAGLPENPSSNWHWGYILGGILAVLIMGYLIYTLIRPEKF
jgi:K+-transporting ATPase KdpF subunit